MADEAQVQKFLQAAVKAAKEGNKENARKGFLAVLKLQPTHEAAWLGLATVAQDKKEQVLALQKVLTLNPNNDKAYEALRRLGAIEEPAPVIAEPEPEPPPPAAPAFEEPPAPAPVAVPSYLADLLGDLPPPAPTPIPPVERAAAPRPAPEPAPREEFEEPPLSEFPPVATTTPLPVAEKIPPAPLFSNLPPMPKGENGVPIPPRRILEQTAAQGEAAAQAYIQQAFADALKVNWQAKTRGRAGERELTIFWLQVSGAVLTFVLISGGITLAVLLNSPEFRAALFEPTWTVSPTATFTPTNTPGASPTPSITPSISATPSPTLNASVTPGNPVNLFPPTRTPIAELRGLRSALLTQAFQAINDNRFDEARDLIEQAQAEVGVSGNFVPWYLLAQLELRENNLEAARTIVQEGEARFRSEANRDTYGVLVETVYAQIALADARNQLASGTRLNNLRDEFEEIETRANAALAYDNSFAPPYIILAERYLLESNPEEALRILNDAQLSRASATIFTDTNLRLTKARIFEQQARYDMVQFELSEILTINPFEKAAWELRIELALRQNDPGLAAIYSEDFLYYFPDSVSGFKLLGDARMMENKPDLALVEYNTALQGETSDPVYVDTLVARARLYRSLRRYDLALADLNEAFALRADDRIRVERMSIAYLANDYETALSDAAALEGSPLLPPDEINLLTTRIQIDQTATIDEGQARELLRTLNNINERRLNPALIPVLDEYLARVHFALGNFGDALNAINRAVQTEPTFTRLSLRGQIRQARGDAETRAADKAFEYAAALQDFDFIMTWSAVYPYSEITQVRERYQVVLEALIVARTPPPTATPRP